MRDTRRREPRRSLSRDLCALLTVFFAAGSLAQAADPCAQGLAMKKDILAMSSFTDGQAGRCQEYRSVLHDRLAQYSIGLNDISWRYAPLCVGRNSGSGDAFGNVLGYFFMRVFTFGICGSQRDISRTRQNDAQALSLSIGQLNEYMTWYCGVSGAPGDASSPEIIKHYAKSIQATLTEVASDGDRFLKDLGCKSIQAPLPNATVAEAGAGSLKATAPAPVAASPDSLGQSGGQASAH